MVGITCYGAYVPLVRLSRDVVAAAWGTSSIGGERSVASYDEDSITMATEAVADCLAGMQRDKIDGLLFASTTSPYREKLCATVVAMVEDALIRAGLATLGTPSEEGWSACVAVKPGRKH